ncbi:MAG: KGG domain-containing protein [Candidatus Thermoplasmatota archaeon]
MVEPTKSEEHAQHKAVKRSEKDEQGVSQEEMPPHPMTIEEAARKGGNTTKERYGPDFYSRIGKKGGQRVARERGPEFYSEIGRKGGEARVAQSKKLEEERETHDESE